MQISAVFLMLNSISTPRPTNISLGRRVSVHLARRRGRWVWFSLALALLLAGFSALVIALQTGYEAYGQFGPAAVGAVVLTPVMLMLTAWLLGGLFLWIGLRREPRAVAIYELGLAWRDREGVRSWAWSDLVTVTAQLTRREFLGILLDASRRYVIECRDGGKAVLDDAWKQVDLLAQVVLRESYPSRYAEAAGRLEAGTPVMFGPLLLGGAGIQLEKVNLAWDEIEALIVRRGKVRMMRTGGKTYAVDAGQVGNLDVLLALLEQQVQVRVEP
jgi:hypothetical protein